MISRLAAFAAMVLSLIAPPGPLPLLGEFLSVLTVLALGTGRQVPYGCLGLPGESSEDNGRRGP